MPNPVRSLRQDLGEILVQLQVVLVFLEIWIAGIFGFDLIGVKHPAACAPEPFPHRLCPVVIESDDTRHGEHALLRFVGALIAIQIKSHNHDGPPTPIHSLLPSGFSHWGMPISLTTSG